jgi:hypothetical protein
MIENFEKLTFHRKIDILVAMHVMEWKDIAIQEVGWGPGTTKWMCVGTDRFNGQGYIPLYSALLTSAWDIVRKSSYCYLFRSTDFKGGQWECKLADRHSKDGLSNTDVYYAWADTEMLAICYAGLKVVGYPLKDFLKGEVV